MQAPSGGDGSQDDQAEDSIEDMSFVESEFEDY